MVWRCGLVQDAGCGRSLAAAMERLSDSDGYAAVRLCEWAADGEWEVVRRTGDGLVVGERLADKCFWQVWRADEGGCRSCGFSVRKGRANWEGKRRWRVVWRVAGLGG